MVVLIGLKAKNEKLLDDWDSATIGLAAEGAAFWAACTVWLFRSVLVLGGLLDRVLEETRLGVEFSSLERKNGFLGAPEVSCGVLLPIWVPNFRGVWISVIDNFFENGKDKKKMVQKKKFKMKRE